MNTSDIVQTLQPQHYYPFGKEPHVQFLSLVVVKVVQYLYYRYFSSCESCQCDSHVAQEVFQFLLSYHVWQPVLYRSLPRHDCLQAIYYNGVKWSYLKLFLNSLLVCVLILIKKTWCMLIILTRLIFHIFFTLGVWHKTGFGSYFM